MFAIIQKLTNETTYYVRYNIKLLNCCRYFEQWFDKKNLNCT